MIYSGAEIGAERVCWRQDALCSSSNGWVCFPPSFQLQMSFPRLYVSCFFFFFFFWLGKLQHLCGHDIICSSLWLALAKQKGKALHLLLRIGLYITTILTKSRAGNFQDVYTMFLEFQSFHVELETKMSKTRSAAAFAFLWENCVANELAYRKE